MRHLGPALAALCAVVFCVELGPRVPQADDAYISYRYARNLVGGHGLVYNPGERVEGFTNLAWTLGIAAGVALGAEAPDVGHALGVLSGVLALAAAFALAWVASGGSAWAGLAPWLVLASTPFARWATSGLETPLFAAAGAGALAAGAAGRMGWATALALAAALTRPEGALLAGLLHASDALRRGWRSWRPAAWTATVLLALTAFRLAYYGAPLPNTFYAKVGGVPPVFGALYAAGFLADGAGWLLPPAAWAAWRLPALRPAGVYALLTFAYVISIGGDALGHSRLLVPVVPVLAALAVCGAALAFARQRALGAAAAACLFAAGLAQWLGVPGGAEGWVPKRSAELRRARAGDALFENLARQRSAVLERRGERSALVATGAIGAFGYYARVPVLDILGLVDAEIARSDPQPGGTALRLPGHQRWNTAYVFRRRPDYILVARKGSPGKGNLPAVAGIWAHPDLERLYVWDEPIQGYRRRDSAP